MRKIKNKFLLAFLLIGLIPLIFMGIISLVSVSRTHKVDIASLELQLLGHKREEILKFIDDTIGILQLQVGFEQKTEISEGDQVFLLQSLLDTNKNLEEVSFLNLDGKETQKLYRGITDTDAVELVNISKLEKFLVPRSGKDYAGNVYYTLRGPMMTLSSPVKNKNGEIIMVLSAELNLSAIQEIAQTARLGNTGYFYVLDSKGKLFAHSQADRLGPRQDLSAVSEQADETTGRFQSSWDEDVFGTSLKLEKTGWALAVEWPAKDAFAVIRIINYELFGILGGSLIVILLLTFWITKKITNPIQVLKEGAKVIGGGDFGHRIQIQTKDEIEELGESFNVMAKDLADIQKIREQAIRAESLEKSLEKEKELSRNKDSFIKNSSHQLRTPLSTILWGLESAVPEAEKINPSLGASVKAAYQGTQNLNEILNDLLTVSEYGLGYVEEKLVPVDVDNIVLEVVKGFQEAFAKKNITLEYRKEGPVQKALGNEAVVKKALTYLIDNELIYANTKTRVVLKESGGEVVVEISDDGVGIPEAEKTSIGNQFFRATNAIVKKNVGTGLGLFIVNNIVRGLSGRFWLESTENKGSTFFFSLQKAPTAD